MKILNLARATIGNLALLQAFLTSLLFTAAIAAPQYPLAYAPVTAPAYPDLPPTYAYNYAIKDDTSLVNLAANEHRDGPVAAGSYQVALPDGRTQTVTYTAGIVSYNDSHQTTPVMAANTLKLAYLICHVSDLYS